MPFLRQHYLLAFGGPLFTEGEQWSMSLRSTPNFAEGGAGSAEDTLTELEAVLRTWWATGPASPNAKLGWLKYNRIAADGKYMHEWSNTRELTTLVTPSASTTRFPPQCAVVATLETGVTRGLAHRGRLFIPVPKHTIAETGRLSAASATDMATSVATLLTNLNGVANYGTNIVASSVREGAERPITGVSMGRVIDTVRSRRAQLKEEREPAVAVTGQETPTAF